MDREGGEGEEQGGEEDNLEDEEHWERLGGEVMHLTLQPNDYGFGLSLAGGLKLHYYERNKNSIKNGVLYFDHQFSKRKF